jgi:hypothetical protein
LGEVVSGDRSSNSFTEISVRYAKSARTVIAGCKGTHSQHAGMLW